jgi:hypothetical protein
MYCHGQEGSVTYKDVRLSDWALTQCPDVYLGHPIPGGYKYGGLALQVGRVSNETVIYGLSSLGLGPQSDSSGKAQKLLSAVQH